MATGRTYQTYRDTAEITLLGRRLKVLDLTREISPDIPVYPGHMKVAIWTHMTHEESRLRGQGHLPSPSATTTRRTGTPPSGTWTGWAGATAPAHLPITDQLQPVVEPQFMHL